MFLDLLMAPITAPLSGITWIAEQVLEKADTALDAKENLGKQLLALQLAFDMGDISEEEFEVQEEELLLAIQTLEDEEREDEERAIADER